jgi:hypothetical protein
VSPADGSNADDLPEIMVDFNSAWGPDLFDLYLPCSVESFEKYGLVPHEGLRIKVRQENLAAAAVIINHQRENGYSFLMAKLTEPLHEVPWD